MCVWSGNAQRHVVGRPLGSLNGLNQRSSAARTPALSVTRRAAARLINICRRLLGTSWTKRIRFAISSIKSYPKSAEFMIGEINRRITLQGSVWNREEFLVHEIIFSGAVGKLII